MCRLRNQSRQKHLLAATRDDGSLSSCTVSARWRCGLDRGGCWSPASADRQAPYTSPPSCLETTGAHGGRGLPGGVCAVVATKWRNRWPRANTRKSWRCRARSQRVWNGVRSLLRTGETQWPCSFFGSVRSAWRRQVPTRSPGSRVRILLRGTVKAIDAHPADTIGWGLRGGRALKYPIGLGQGGCTGLLGIAQMPEDSAADDRGQVHFGGETAAVLLVGQQLGRQCETTPGEHGHQALC